MLDKPEKALDKLKKLLVNFFKSGQTFLNLFLTATFTYTIIRMLWICV